MSSWILSFEQWQVICSILPQPVCSSRGGRPRSDAKKAFQAILWVIRQGKSWNSIPVEASFASSTTTWRRFKEWQRLNVLPLMFMVFLGSIEEAQVDQWKKDFEVFNNKFKLYESVSKKEDSLEVCKEESVHSNVFLPQYISPLRESDQRSALKEQEDLVLSSMSEHELSKEAII